MTNHTDCQNSDTTSQDTTTSIGSLLYPIGKEITEFGVKFYIKPLQESVTIAPSQNRETKDLIHCISYIPKNQNYIFLQRAINHPMIYHQKENERREEGLELLELTNNEPIGIIIQIH